MTDPPRPALYASAALAVVGMAALGLLLDPLIARTVPFMPFFLAIAAAAWYGGLGPGLLATVLSAATGEALFGYPEKLFGPGAGAELSRLGIFLVVGGILSVLTEGLHRARRQAERNARHAHDAEQRWRGLAAERKQAEESVRRNSALLRAVVEGTTDPVFVKDLEGRFLMVNPALAAFLERAEEELVGRRDDELIPPEAAQRSRETDRQVIETGHPQTYEQPAEAGGKLRHFLVTKAPYRDAEGRSIGVVGIAHDVTPQRESEERIRLLNREQQRQLAELQAILNLMPVGIGIARDAACREVSANAYYARLLGLDPGQNASVSLPLEQHSTAVRVFWEGSEVQPGDLPVERAAATGQEVTDLELEFRLPDGQARSVLASAVPLLDESGRPHGAVGSFADITERKWAQKAEKLLAEASTVLGSSLDYEATLAAVTRLVVPAMADWCAVHLAGEDGSVQRLAASGAEGGMAPSAAEDAIASEGVPKVLRTGRAELYPEVLAAVVREGQPPELVGGMGTRSAMIVPLLATGRTLGALSFVAGESGRRYGARDLAVAESLAARAAIAVDHARLFRDAQEANRLKDEFLATLSHELRTPLNAIVGWTHLLRTGGLDAATAAHALEVIDRNAKMQSELVADILDVSRIVTGKLHLERRAVDLSRVIEGALETVRPAAAAKRIELVAPPESASLMAWGDPDRLQQVVWNLLSNAIKFTPGGGRVEVTMAATVGYAEVAVADTGCGIPDDFLPHVFERFRQADSSSTRQHRGLGLGLSIVRHLAEAHGGTVEATSAGLGKGAIFRVRLPLPASLEGPAAAPASRARDSADPGLQGVRVLVVEDDLETRELIAAVLSQRGARVTGVGSASEGLVALEQDPPDLVMSDLEMPGEDGFSFIRKLRARTDSSGKLLPAVALTGYARDEDRDQALRAGFQVHLPKPVDPTQMLAVVSGLLRARR